METGNSDLLGAFRTINKTIDVVQRSREFMTLTNSEVQSGIDWNTGSGVTPADSEADYEEKSRQRIKTRVSTST